MNINEKRVYSAIDKQLKIQCADTPKYLPKSVFEKTDEMSDQLEYVDKYHFRNMFKLTPAIRRQLKSMFIYAVIHDRVYNEKLARRLHVKTSDINATYNVYSHYRRYLTQQVEYPLFLGYLYEKAKESYCLEIKAREEFELRSSLEQETHQCPPRYWLENQIGLVNFEIKELKQSLKSLQVEMKIGMVVPVEFNNERSALNQSIQKKNIELNSLNKRLNGKRPKGERKNFFYIERFRLMDLKGNGEIVPYILRIGSASIVKETLREYCSWFNRKYADEIKSHQSIVRKEKQRLAYEKRNEEKLQQKKEKAMLLQQEVHQCMKKGLSLRKTAAKLNVSYGSVRRSSKQIEVLILAQ